MKYVFSGLFWIGVYLALVMAPLLVLLLGPMPAGSGFWWDLSLALGFAGTAMMGTLFVQTARFRRPSAPFGIDIVYYFHRQSALAAFLFILAHPVVLLWREPPLWAFFRPGLAPWHFWAGVASLLALSLLLISSLWRKPLSIDYDRWRLGHALLAVLALGLAIGHIVGVGHYAAAPWTKVLWGVISLSCLLLLVTVRIIRPAMLLRRPYRVTGVSAERGEAWTLQVVPAGHDGFSFLPGQFAWITLGASPFALKEHPFSIASSSEKAAELHFTIKELGDFTSRIKEVEVGTPVYVDGPYGCFSLDRQPASSYVFVAGGIGIAPIMGMLRTLADRGDRRPLLLLYAYNTWDRLTFREELEALRDRLNLRLVFVLNDPPPDWQGEEGLLTRDLLLRHVPQPLTAAEYFICGPVAMIHIAEKYLHELGVPLGQLHSELFDLV
ncbi:ferric reductase-like transmembrane domain-containing protein [Desulfuromonas sp. AOP6]|uniref:ferredoxin reductase family protein n=1 Tax=Desulfuromonas sp. AOP6 TaxID=1566351 RepID=UPI001278D0A0|nr:ferric reductase-like transmembrane domain-containing protein [Desulfuromonas sp. AOP6]BCA78890.1 hypothetical protein AOP6_0677 [Desulfuromonas sp. AOP6]